MMHGLMQQVDSSIALGHLSGCDLPLDLDGIIRRDLFFVYTTQAKKHVHEMMVMLHRSHVVFARPKRKKGTENIVYEFTNSMEVCPPFFIHNILYTCTCTCISVIKGLIRAMYIYMYGLISPCHDNKLYCIHCRYPSCTCWKPTSLVWINLPCVRKDRPLTTSMCYRYRQAPIHIHMYCIRTP